jgi:very-short-patch-repair endonuclease
VSSLVPAYPNNRDCVDWYIDELNIVLELHGKQHYQMQSFGSKDSVFNQKKNFYNIKFRDNRKKTSLLNANINYIEISYKDKSKITADYLKNLILNKESS